VVALVDQVIVDSLGIAFEGVELKLGKQPTPISHSVIRDEERSSQGEISALRYRVRDFAAHEADFEAVAPGVDRRDFSRSDPQNEPTLVSLTDDQIADRIGDEPDERRILAPLTCTAERIHLVDNQIDQLLCLSRIEHDEQLRAVLDGIRGDIETQVRTDEGDDVIADLEQTLGRPPTNQEITDAVNKRVAERVQEIFDQRFPDFNEDDLPDEIADLLEEAIAKILRFDWAPEEMILRQQEGVVILDGKEIIVRHNADGSTTP
jgi:hypothetical protein